MGIGAAVAAGVGAVGAIGGALISSSASKSAASTQAAAANNATAAAQAQFEQTQQTEAPFVQAGSTALGSLESGLGLPNTTGPGGSAGPASNNPLTANGIPGLTFQPTQAQLEATPGYQFDLEQGLQATQNANSATGNGVSGNALKGAAAYATGLANNTLTTQQGIYQQNLSNVLTPLQSLVNSGQQAGLQVGQQGLQATQNANAFAVGGANASAAGTVGAANALTSGLSSVANAPLNYALYSQLLGGNVGVGNAASSGYY